MVTQRKPPDAGAREGRKLPAKTSASSAPEAAASPSPPALRQAVPHHPTPPVRDGHPSKAVQVLAAAMPEDELLNRITSGTKREPGLCVQLGLRWYHTRDSRRSPHGWPDLVIAGRSGGVGPAFVMFRELKREGGKPTPAQEWWLGLLMSSGLDAGIWTPSDLLSGRIARELAKRAGLGCTRLASGPGES